MALIRKGTTTVVKPPLLPEFVAVTKNCGALLKQLAADGMWPAPTVTSSSTFKSDDTLIANLAKQSPTNLSLRDLYTFSDADPKRRIHQAAFLHREVPIRFAHRAMELQNLPFGLSEKPAVMKAAGWYYDIVKNLVAIPAPATVEQEVRFGKILASLLLSHTTVPQALSRGVMELKQSVDLPIVDQHRVDRILDNFFTSRISMRFLVEQYIASAKNRPNWRGIIHSECSPVEVAHKASVDVMQLCKYHLGVSPEIEVHGQPSDTFTAVPSHLYYILCELLKNSCRATVEHARHKNGLDPRAQPPLDAKVAAVPLPPVKVIIAKGREDITIKVVDEGGGIKRSDLQHVWSYMFSTAPSPSPDQFGTVPLDHMTGATRRQLIAELDTTPSSESRFSFSGYGMGLPLSRLYAKYWGGSLKLRPCEGYGTDAYVHLHRLKTNSREALPGDLSVMLEKMGQDGRMSTGLQPWRKPTTQDTDKDDELARKLLRSCCSV